MIEAYPLSWPLGFARSKHRIGGAFKTTLAGALNNVETSVRLFARDSGKVASGLVISSNVSLGQQRPADPGIAVWFTWDGLQVCIPVDRYDKVEGNLQAVHHILEARRVELRHGGIAIVRATFTGFKLLPAPARTSPEGWRAILGIPVTETPALDVVESKYKALRSKHHPDKPDGDQRKFILVQTAWEQAQQEIAK